MNRPVLPLAILALLLAVAAPAWAQRGDPSADFVASQKSRGATAAAVAAELQKTYREPSDRIATLLIGGGYRPAPVLTTLVMDLRFPLASATEDVQSSIQSVEAYEPSEAEQMAQALANADYSASEVADVLVQLYDASAEQVAGALRYAGYENRQLALALQIVLGHDPAANITTLRAIGDSCTDALYALVGEDGGPPWYNALLNGYAPHPAELFSGTIEVLAAALYSTGCSWSDVQAAFLEVLPPHIMARKLASILEP